MSPNQDLNNSAQSKDGECWNINCSIICNDTVTLIWLKHLYMGDTRRFVQHQPGINIAELTSYLSLLLATT
jgi:hypothetical protein